MRLRWSPVSVSRVSASSLMARFTPSRVAEDVGEGTIAPRDTPVRVRYDYGEQRGVQGLMAYGNLAVRVAQPLVRGYHFGLPGPEGPEHLVEARPYAGKLVVPGLRYLLGGVRRPGDAHGALADAVDPGEDGSVQYYEHYGEEYDISERDASEASIESSSGGT